MKRPGKRLVRWSELDSRFGARPAGLWRRYLADLKLPELAFEPDGSGASFADYLPLEGLLGEMLDAEARDLRGCAECGEFYDIDRTDGIFADFEHLAGWICAPCARKLSAWDFYHRHVAGSGK